MNEHQNRNPSVVPVPSGPVVQDHELLRCIGRGSYGEVWLARNVIGAYRAIKVVYRNTFETERPFEREFSGIQKFEPISRTHPGFVDVLQIGRNDSEGYFYYVMELADDEVAGQEFHPDSYSPKTLSSGLDNRDRLSFAECLDVGLSLSGALAHLHANGLIHRDIKPSNIIFVQGEPKLADIGLVAPVGEANTVVGTEGYIAPEGPNSPQADIFSLGKVLYEISTGKDRKNFPELPTRLDELDEHGQLVELNEIIIRACAPALADRYQTAGELHADIQVLRAGRSVKRLRALEKRIALITRVAIVAAVIAVLAGAATLFVNIARQREQGFLARAYDAAGSRLIEDGKPYAALPYFAEALRLQEKNAAAAQMERARIGTILSQGPKLVRLWTNGGPVKAIAFSADSSKLLFGVRTTARIRDVQSGDLTGVEFVMPGHIETAVFSPDGDRVLLAGGRMVSMADAKTGERIHAWNLTSSAKGASFSPDGKRVVVGCSDKNAYIFDVESRQQIAKFVAHTQQVSRAIFSPDGQTVVTASSDWTARIWDANTGSLKRAPLQHSDWVYDTALSPDGRILATAGDRALRLWNTDSYQPLFTRLAHENSVRGVAFSPDGRFAASASIDHTVRVWDTRAGRLAFPVLHHGVPAMSVAFSSDGRWLATSDHAGRIKVWDLFLRGPEDYGNAFFCRSGDRFVTITNESLQVWRTADRTPISPPINVGQSINEVHVNRDGTLVLLLTHAGSNTMASAAREAASYRPGPWFQIGWAPRAIVSSEDGSRLLVGLTNAVKPDHTFSVWDTATGKRVTGPIQQPRTVRSGAFSPDNRRLATICGEEVRIWDSVTGQPIGVPLRHHRHTEYVAFSRDGERVVTTSSDSDWNACSAFIWEVTTGRRIGAAMNHDDGVLMAAMSPREDLVVTAGEDSRATVWQTKDGEPVGHSLHHRQQVVYSRFTDDGRWLLTVGSDYSVKIWETATGFLIAGEFGHHEAATAAGFLAGNTKLWVRLKNRAVVWNLPGARENQPELKTLLANLGTASELRGHEGWKLSDTDINTEAVNHRPLAVSLADLSAWHLAQAEACERERSWFGLRFHLTKLVQLDPANSDFQMRLQAAEQQFTQKPTGVQP